MEYVTVQTCAIGYTLIWVGFTLYCKKVSKGSQRWWGYILDGFVLSTMISIASSSFLFFFWVLINAIAGNYN
jgi:hypothetical protein